MARETNDLTLIEIIMIVLIPGVIVWFGWTISAHFVSLNRPVQAMEERPAEREKK